MASAATLRAELRRIAKVLELWHSYESVLNEPQLDAEVYSCLQSVLVLLAEEEHETDPRY